MKPVGNGFEVKKRSGFSELPPKGAYVAEIKKAEEVELKGNHFLEITLDICEGEYKDRYTQVWRDQEERFGNANFKGIFRLPVPTGEPNDWREQRMAENLWCVNQSNPGYEWDWDERKLKGKKVGINLRNRLYTYNGQERSTTEIGQFETIDDVRNGKCKNLKDRDQRERQAETAGSNDYSNVSGDVDVPWA